MGRRLFPQQLHVFDSIFLVAKDIGATISALSDVVSAVRHNNPGSSWHKFFVKDRAKEGWNIARSQRAKAAYCKGVATRRKFLSVPN